MFAFDAAPGAQPAAGLAASPQKAAIALSVDDDTGDFTYTQALAGPPAGPFTPLTPLVKREEGAVLQLRNQVVGETVFSTEIRGSIDNWAVVARDPEPHDVPQLPPTAFTVVFAGDLVAYGSERRLVVQDWRTGAVRTAIDLPDPAEQVALRPDGRVAAVTTEGALYDGTRRLTGRAEAVAFAGDRIVFRYQGAMRVIEPSGRIRAFGVPSYYLEGFTTDGTRVMWWTQQCLMLADASEPAADAIGPGPCPRSEAVVDEEADDAPVAATVPVRIECIAAPRRCRGSLRLTRGRLQTAKVRFAIPTGRTGTVRVRLGTRLYRHVRHVVAHERNTSLTADVRTDDGFRPPGNAGQNVWVSRQE